MSDPELMDDLMDGLLRSRRACRVLAACPGSRLSQTLAHAQSQDALSDSHSVAV